MHLHSSRIDKNARLQKQVIIVESSSKALCIVEGSELAACDNSEILLPSFVLMYILLLNGMMFFVCSQLP